MASSTVKSPDNVAIGYCDFVHSHQCRNIRDAVYYEKASSHLHLGEKCTDVVRKHSFIPGSKGIFQSIALDNLVNKWLKQNRATNTHRQ